MSQKLIGMDDERRLHTFCERLTMTEVAVGAGVRSGGVTWSASVLRMTTRSSHETRCLDPLQRAPAKGIFVIDQGQLERGSVSLFGMY